MSCENCNDRLCSRNKQLFRFLGLKEIKTLNYLTQMLLSWLDRWSTETGFLQLKHALIIISRLRHLIGSWHLFIQLFGI